MPFVIHLAINIKGKRSELHVKPETMVLKVVGIVGSPRRDEHLFARNIF
jgi:hypothetical protein